MLDATSKALFHGLAQISDTAAAGVEVRDGARAASPAASSPANRSTKRSPRSPTCPARACCLTLDYLGESVVERRGRGRGAADYVQIIDAIVASGIERNISLKLTQLGLDVDRATAVDNMRRILEPADANGFFVRIDMENSPYTDATLEILETLWRQGHRNVGTVIQSYLKRSEDDVRRLNALGARVRLVKGAYKEPKTVAYQKKSEVDAAFVELMQTAARRRHVSGDRHARSRR